MLKAASTFFAVVTYRREPIFASDSAVQLLLEVLDHVARQHPFETHASVVLHDHLHTLWTLPEGDAEFSLRWRLIKERFTRRYRQRTVREMPVWQNRFWEHFIRDERDLARHRDYIHLNPVHHGYVTAPGARRLAPLDISRVGRSWRLR